MARLLEGERRERYRASRDRLFVRGIHLLRGMLGLFGVRRASRAGGAVGALVGRVLGEPAAVAREQIDDVLAERSPSEREEIRRAMFRGHGSSMAEIILLDRIAADIDLWVDGEGIDVMDRALAKGRGVIAITGHIGNWELLAAWFGLKGYPVSVIATPVKGEALNRENVELRLRSGVETIARDGPGSSKAILRTLRGGRILAILMDQDTHGQGVVVPFFDRPAFTPVGPAALAWRTGAALVGVFIHRGPDGRHRVKVVDPELPERAGEDAAARDAWQRETTAALNRLIEAEVRTRPDEWVWWHRRWRRGSGAASGASEGQDTASGAASGAASGTRAPTGAEGAS